MNTITQVVKAILAGKIAYAIKSEPLLVAVQKLLATPKGLQLSVGDDVLTLKVVPALLSKKATKLLSDANVPTHGAPGALTFDFEAAGFERLSVTNAVEPVYGFAVDADYFCEMIESHIDSLHAKGAKLLPGFDGDDIWSVMTGHGVDIDHTLIYLSGEHNQLRVSDEPPIGIPHLDQYAMPAKIGESVGYLLGGKGGQSVFLAVGPKGFIKQILLLQQVATESLAVMATPLVNVAEGLGLHLAKSAGTDPFTIAPVILPVMSTATVVVVDQTAIGSLQAAVARVASSAA